jgi:hypothetical protein
MLAEKRFKSEDLHAEHQKFQQAESEKRVNILFSPQSTY